MIHGRFFKDGHCTEVIFSDKIIGGKKMIPRFTEVEKLIDDLNDAVSEATASWLETNRELELGRLRALELAVSIVKSQPQIEASKVRKSCETCRHRRKHWTMEPCASCKFDDYDGSEWESIRGKWLEMKSNSYQCSECACKVHAKSNFCPDCGSPMDV